MQKYSCPGKIMDVSILFSTHYRLLPSIEHKLCNIYHLVHLTYREVHFVKVHVFSRSLNLNLDVD